MTIPTAPEIAPSPLYALATPYAGANHFRWPTAPKLSPLGTAVADIIGHLYGGLYHLPNVDRVDWTDPFCITVNVHASHYATFDFGYLTRLVVLCHDMCIRCEIGSSGPGMIKLRFHARTRDGSMSERHPTMEDNAAQIRSGYTVSQLPTPPAVGEGKL